jgi:hypothetical protein
MKEKMMSNTDYQKQSEYQVVQKFIQELSADGTLMRFQGACLPASEITQAILHARGVKSRLLECTALVVNSPTNGGSIEVIGFNTLVPLGPLETDTHFVVLVEARVPFIIDLSVGHKMGSDKYAVVAPLFATDPEIIAQASFQAASVTYRVKKNPRYLTLHQKTMLDKLEEDRDTRDRLQGVGVLVKVAIGLSLLNFAANALLVMLKTTLG